MQKQMMMLADQQCSKYDKLEPYMVNKILLYTITILLIDANI